MFKSLKKFGNSIGNTTNHTIHKIEKVGNQTAKTIVKTANKTADIVENAGDLMINGRDDLPIYVKQYISKHGSENIISIEIVRTPINKVIQGIFDNTLKNSDKTLYHLQMWIKTDHGNNFVLEKNAAITIGKFGGKTKESEVMVVNNIPSNLTIQELMDKTRAYMGSKDFISYSVNNNCQKFIDSVLSSNGLNNNDLHLFVKQATQDLFKNQTGMRKLSNTLSGVVGERLDVVVNGQGSLDKKYLKKLSKKELIEMICNE